MNNMETRSRKANYFVGMISLVAGALLFPSGLAAQEVQRIALERTASVRANTVRLSDLLPALAREPLRSRAQQIVLGDAPVLGADREFTREQIQRLLSGFPDLRNELDIPPQIDVRRLSWRITPEEVLAAIDRTLRANGSAAGEELVPDDVRLAANIAVTESAPRLQVTQFQASRDGHGTRVLIWVVSEPRVPPFWVQLDRAIHLRTSRPASTLQTGPSDDLPARPAENTIVPASESRMTRTPAQDPVLVRAGDPVELLVQVGGMRIQGTGIPLDRGGRGDAVRVRAASSNRIIVGTVIGEQIVQVTF